MGFKASCRLVIVFLFTLIEGCSLFYPRAAVMYAEDNDVSYAEAEYRISIQYEIGELQAVLMQDKEHFSGLYIEHIPMYSVNVLYKNKLDTPELDVFIADKSWKKFVKVRQVKASLEDLSHAQREAGDIMRKIKMDHSSAGYFDKNNVELYVLDKSLLNKLLIEKNLNLSKLIKIVEVSGFAEPE